MNCDTVERENIVERYIAGALEPALNEEWEKHYFGCERCSEQLETWIAIEKPLRAMDARIRAEMQPPRSRRAPRSYWVAAAIAATLLICVAVRFRLVQIRHADTVSSYKSGPPPEFIELTQVDPPAYAAPVMRGVETKAESQFFEAMKFYRAQRYSRAIPGLQASLREDPAAAPPRFFLGACYLLSDRSAEAAAQLSKVAAGGSPFAEEAQFYLAKAYLLEGKRAEAIAALRPLAASQGEFSRQGRQLLDRLSSSR